jgi:DNA ligase D-like protein (predicted 3'-phosphoesterase)
MTGLRNPRFVLHEHISKHPHFDLRFEHEGVLKSWAVPKGLPEKSGERRLAIAVEDHPVGYIGFEGTIPEGGYGAGDVKIHDNGTYEPLTWGDERIEVIFHGSTIRGKYVLLRFQKAGDKNWIILKSKS